MKPIIGITASMETDETKYMVHHDNVSAITKNEGIPLMLPYVLGEDEVEQIAHQLDGLYATGGYDIDPTLFGEEPHQHLGTIIPARDAFEIALMKRMLAMGKPILGVCRGCQILNIAVGGDMYQDMYSQKNEELLQHQQQAPAYHASHFVHIEKNSLLYGLTSTEKIKVNSRHHQANRHVPESFRVSGIASDGVIEAIESNVHDFALGLQWHPESMLAVHDEASQKIFQGFITAANTIRS